MKILLAYPYCLEKRIHKEDAGVVPIGLYYIGSVVRELGHDVDIINFENLSHDPDKIEEVLKHSEPDVIGFSVVSANRWGGIDIARIAKKIFPNVNVVFGGVGATFLCDLLLEHFEAIDFVVLGEGERVFSELINRLAHQNRNSLEDIPGLAYRRNGKILKTDPPPPIRNLDELPIPARHFTYQHVALSRGCPGNCTFCGSPQFWGRKVRFHSPGWFVKQLEILYEKGVRHFYVSDDTFTMDKDRVIEVCRAIISKNLEISWVAISRVNYVDEDILYWMRKAGCVQISFGVESGSKEIRHLLNKKITDSDIKNAFALTTKYGILARAYFIYGCPGENRRTIDETIDLIHEIKPLSVIFYILDIFPGTSMYKDFMETYGISEDIWLDRIEDILYCEYDPRMSKKMILDFGKTLRSGFFKNLPGYVDAIKLTDNPEFTALNADFLSRLAMTFTHGDYAAIKTIPEKSEIAERLYKKALDYYPQHRSFLGLGILYQKRGNNPAAIEILSKGLALFKDNEPLTVSLGISYANLGDFQTALSCFEKFPDSKQALTFTGFCYQAMGEMEKASEISGKLDVM